MGLHTPAAPAAAPAGLVLQRYRGAHGVHNALSLVLTTHRSQTALATYNAAAPGQQVTVIITFPKASAATLAGHPGHCGVALWNTSNNQYTTAGIFDNGSFGAEKFNMARFRRDARYELWFFTTGVTPTVAQQVLAQMQAFVASPQGYAQVLGTRLLGTYNCVTAADAILGAGGLSAGVASAVSTPYLYSCSFALWPASSIDGARHD